MQVKTAINFLMSRIATEKNATRLSLGFTTLMFGAIALLIAGVAGTMSIDIYRNGFDSPALWALISILAFLVLSYCVGYVLSGTKLTLVTEPMGKDDKR